MKRLIAGALAGLMVSAPLYPSHANLNLNGAIIEMSSPGLCSLLVQWFNLSKRSW